MASWLFTHHILVRPLDILLKRPMFPLQSFLLYADHVDLCRLKSFAVQTPPFHVRCMKLSHKTGTHKNSQHCGIKSLQVFRLYISFRIRFLLWDLSQVFRPKPIVKLSFQNLGDPKAMSFCRIRTALWEGDSGRQSYGANLNHVPAFIYLLGLIIPLIPWRIDRGFFLLGRMWR